MRTLNNYPEFNIQQYRHYVDLSLAKIEDILGALSIEYLIKSRYMVNILCPVHSSTDFASSSIRLSDGKWTCWSRSCNKDVGSNFLHLIKWAIQQTTENIIYITDVYRFIDDPSFKAIERPKVQIIQQEFNTLDYPQVQTPSKYFIGRGFAESVLTKFNIGDCYVGKYINKAIVPIKNVSGKLVGFSARSIFDKCDKCDHYHSRFEMCITNSTKYPNMYKKWVHSYGLRTSVSPYNIENIKLNKVAVLEGPSCVWRLDEFDIGAIACLGKEFTVGHKNVLKNIGVTKVLFISDNDEAGKLFRSKFVAENNKDFEIYFPKQMTDKDVSDMDTESIKTNIVSVWEKI